MLRKSRNGSRQQIAAGTGRHIIEDHRLFGSIGDLGIMGDQAILSSLVIIGSYHQQGISAIVTSTLGIIQNMQGVVGAHTGDHRHTAIDPLNSKANHRLALLRSQCGTFTGGTYCHQCVNAGFQLKINKTSHGVVVYCTCRSHRGYQGGSHTLKDNIFHTEDLLV